MNAMLLRLSIILYVVLFSEVTATNSGKDDKTSKSQENSDQTNKYRYLPTWKSLESRTLPEWYDRDKFGILVHWGIYSVIGYGDWFWRKDRSHSVATEVTAETYKPETSCQDLAREFTADFFNPDEWANLFKQAGARYVVLTAKHHEGYALWPSTYSFSWNSVDVGAHRDLVSELAKAVRKHEGLHFGLYYSLYELYNRLYLEDKKNNFKTRRFVEMKTIPELHELIGTIGIGDNYAGGEVCALELIRRLQEELRISK